MKSKKFEHLSEQEMAEAIVFPHELTPDEKVAADAEIKRLRMSRLGQMSDTQQIYAELLRLKFQVEEYLKHGKYEEQYSLGAFLRKYLAVLGRKQKEFAAEINLHPTTLNQILNDKADANASLVYRLEKHCNGLISATDWWNLHAKKIEADIQNDRESRIAAEKNVKRGLVFGGQPGVGGFGA